jgi:hypothetical protein
MRGGALGLWHLLTRPALATASENAAAAAEEAAAEPEAPQTLDSGRKELAAALKARVRDERARAAAAAAALAGGGLDGAAAECVACLEQHAQGLVCGEGHFVCAACVGMYVAAEGDDLYRLRANEGRLCCPQRGAGCGSAPFAHEYMRATLPAAALEAYERLQERVRQMREVDAADGGGGAAAGAAGAGADAEEAVLRLHVRHVEEELLTARCPRCRRAFADFDGCAALRCFGCGCGFCAWCLADCGADAHAHVAACPESPAVDPARALAAYYAPDRVMRDRAARRLLAFLAGLAPALADKVRTRIRHHLVDLGL